MNGPNRILINYRTVDRAGFKLKDILRKMTVQRREYTPYIEGSFEVPRDMPEGELFIQEILRSRIVGLTAELLPSSLNIFNHLLKDLWFPIHQVPAVILLQQVFILPCEIISEKRPFNTCKILELDIDVKALKI